MTDKPQPKRIRESIQHAAKKLQPTRITCNADLDIGFLEAEILLAHTIGKDRTWLRIHDDTLLTPTQSRRFQVLVKRRQNHEPIAYLVGVKEFYELPFFVNRHVLIPRPDSELLVDLARKALFSEPHASDLVLDIGTGSGAVALAIATHVAPRQVLATDISTQALRVAKKNARLLKQSNVTFIQANLLDTKLRHRLKQHAYKKLIIVANLPYLPISDKKKLEQDVVRYEPANALFTKKDGTALMERLMKQLAASNVRFTSVFFEYDPPQTKKLRALAKQIFPQMRIRIHKDLAGKNRVIEISR